MKQSNIEELPGYEELFQKLVEAMPTEKRLAGLPAAEVAGAYPPEQLLGAYAPEQRVAGLTPEQLAMVMPLEMLRGLSEEYLRSLPDEVQERIRRRLQDAAH